MCGGLGSRSAHPLFIQIPWTLIGHSSMVFLNKRCTALLRPEELYLFQAVLITCLASFVALLMKRPMT